MPPGTRLGCMPSEKLTSGAASAGPHQELPSGHRALSLHHFLSLRRPAQDRKAQRVGFCGPARPLGKNFSQLLSCYMKMNNRRGRVRTHWKQLEDGLAGPPSCKSDGWSGEGTNKEAILQQCFRSIAKEQTATLLTRRKHRDSRLRLSTAIQSAWRPPQERLLRGDHPREHTSQT